MAKFISLKFQPAVGTEFDYLINVEDVLNVTSLTQLFLACGETLDFPLDVSADTGTYQGIKMREYIRDLFLDAKQRAGNAYVVAAEDGPFDITAFA